ncbi:MAG: cysteine--tRNA ligase [Mycoplasmatales bacterium]|nr:cysteine--tRNA ligase [Mycoplasmatales bacterium]
MKNIYLCGPTVYSTPHIGNMRPILSFDIVIKALKYLGNDVNFIHNITDIDDKIINQSIEEKLSEKEISERYTAEYFELLTNYNISMPNHLPKVTDKIEEIIKFIQKIIDKGKAYLIDGSVYFSVKKSLNYGEISNQKINEMKFEESNKRHPGDFVLWKRTSKGISFNSPWSKGRPGWHTECASFIDEILNGESLDIHGGGIDLIFPHHENENAQYKSINDRNISLKWKHIGQLNINHKKMSKSLGNIIKADEFADNYEADTLRMLILNSSPTIPINIDEKILTQNKLLVDKFAKVYAKAQLNDFDEKVSIKKIAEFLSNWEFSKAMKEINLIIKSFNKDGSKASEIIKIMKLLSFNFSKNHINSKTKKIYLEWIKLRNENNYEKADELRNILDKDGLI